MRKTLKPNVKMPFWPRISTVGKKLAQSPLFSSQVLRGSLKVPKTVQRTNQKSGPKESPGFPYFLMFHQKGTSSY